MTMTFSVLLALIFLLEFGAGISAYMLRANVSTHAQNSIWKRYSFDNNDAQLINEAYFKLQVDSVIEEKMESSLKNYGEEGYDGVTRTWDIVQHEVNYVA